MSVLTKTLKFTSPTSTGSQSYSSLGFQPKVIFFFGTYQTAEGAGVGAHHMVGAASSSSSQFITAFSALDNANPTSAHRYYSSTACIAQRNVSGVTLLGALTSMDANGFTINWTIVQGTAYNCYALCIGGDEITNVNVKAWAANTGTGNQSVTGVGFQPDSLILLTSGDSSTPPSANTTYFGSFGAGLSATNRFVVGYRQNDAAAASISASKAWETTKIIELCAGNAIVQNAADLVSLDSDGFTVNWTTAAGSARIIGAVSIKGANLMTGSFNQKTSTGTSATTGVGFLPSAVMIASAGVTATGVTATQMATFGAATSSSNRFCTWDGGTSAVYPSETDQYNQSDAFIRFMTAGTPTTEAVADFTSMDSDGFTVNWTTADANARQIGYIAIGGTAIPTGATSNNLLLMGVG